MNANLVISKFTRDYITDNDPWLVRQRNLSIPNNLEDLLMEAHNATMSNERVAEIFKPLCLPLGDQGGYERLGKN